VSATAVLGFLRRELAPTPGRGSATFRLTLACLIATIPILTHRFPFALVVMIVMYLITQEDTAATLLGSILGAVGVTISLGLALLAWMIALDIAWLRICITAAFLFGGLFLKRVLSVGALGSALGLPGALVMILPDAMTVPGAFSPSPEVLTELVLWLWLCVTLGLAVNLGVQLLLAPGDPLTLLQRELDTRLRVVAETVHRLAGVAVAVPRPASASLESLATAGMSRPLALLKSASLTRTWARQHHEELAAIITLVDRLVTDAAAFSTLMGSSPDAAARASLLRVGDGCELARKAFAERRRPAPRDWQVPSAPTAVTTAWPPLGDMERALDAITLAVRIREPAARPKEAKPGLLLPDAFTNPEYVQFAVKGAVACLICYVLFIGLDYPGIYTSVITCFVVSLSTIGSSNQKGLLRFAGAALGGFMGLVALVYVFPNVDGIGGFWLVFGAGTAVAAWINFGTPRVSYGGYQTGLAFYKAVFQSFGPAVSATVIRDRLIGVAFGLIVFGLLEHVLWPARAADRMRERLADVLHSLAGLAQVGAGTGRAGARDVDAQRQLISQQVADVQGFIESSKFEPGAASPERIQRVTAHAQTVFLVLLALARDEAERPIFEGAARDAARRIDKEVAAALKALADHLQRRGARPSTDVGAALSALEGSISANAAVPGDHDRASRGRLALYRELVAALNQLVADDLEEPVVRDHPADRYRQVEHSGA
jgi:multidrug resistance protein MdtO